MTKEQLFKMLENLKLNKQQYKTIKGQIKKDDLIGAYKGILKIRSNNDRYIQ